MRKNLFGVLLSLLLMAAGAGCGSEGEGSSEPDREITFTYVSWAEGIAMTHLAKVVMEDSLGYDVNLIQAGGAPIAFSSLAQGDADVFLDAWLPITHGRLWDKYENQVVDLGYSYESTEVGLVVPAYMPVSHVQELKKYRDELGGQIVGIESGAAINQQAEEVIQQEALDGFQVVASSGPAMAASLRRAYERQEPIVLTGWKPHWMWGQFDLKFLEGAGTGSSDVFGAPENIHKLTRPGFKADHPAEAVQFLENFHLSDEQMASLMNAIRPAEEEPLEAARQWIQEHKAVVSSWLPS